MNGAERAHARGLRILMTTDAVGGVFSYTTTLARALCADGDRVFLVVQGPRATAAKLAPLADTPGLEVVETDLDLEWRDPNGADFSRALAELERIAARVRPDIVHLNGFREALASYDAPVVVTAHSCVGTWWRACRGGAPDASWDAYTRNVRAGLDRADAWIAPSCTFRDAMGALYAPRTRGHVVHNGVAPVMPGTSGRPVVLAAGRMWDEGKDVATIVAAAPHMRWPVEIAGATRADDDRAPDGDAVFLGELLQADLRARMREAGIFVSAAVYEPFGLSVLEAAAAGCALVLADIPSARELWGETALFFTPRVPDDLARQVNALADGDHLCSTMRARSVNRARRYTADRTLAGTRAVYDTVLHRASSAPLAACA